MHRTVPGTILKAVAQIAIAIAIANSWGAIIWAHIQGAWLTALPLGLWAQGFGCLGDSKSMVTCGLHSSSNVVRCAEDTSKERASMNVLQRGMLKDARRSMISMAFAGASVRKANYCHVSNLCHCAANAAASVPAV